MSPPCLANTLYEDVALMRDDAEAMKECARVVLETVDSSQLKIKAWHQFVVNCSKASLAMRFSVATSEFDDISLNSVVPSKGVLDMDELFTHPFAPILKRELPFVVTCLNELVHRVAYAQFKPELMDVCSDAARILACLEEPVQD